MPIQLPVDVDPPTPEDAEASDIATTAISPMPATMGKLVRPVLRMLRDHGEEMRIRDIQLGMPEIRMSIPKLLSYLQVEGYVYRHHAEDGTFQYGVTSFGERFTKAD